jgi:hypothetical protein
MDALPPPLAFFLLLFSGWVNRQQQAVIDYLLEENRVLCAERGSRRLRLTDTTAFRRMLRDSGVKPLLLPARSPNLNAYAERFVLSAKSECLERIVPLGEKHLRAAVREFVDHYHEERPHQGLGNELIAPQAKVIGTGTLKCRERLGGVLKFYYREAA